MSDNKKAEVEVVLTTSPEEAAALEKAKALEQAKRDEMDRALEGEAAEIATEWRQMEKDSATRFFALGKRCDSWLKRKLESGSARADAMKILQQQLLLAGCEGAGADINRAVQTYHAGELFGESFQELPVGVQKPLATFAERDPRTETWGLKAEYAKPARKLYDKAVAKKMTGAEIRDAVNKIKGKAPSAATERGDVEALEEPKGAKALSKKPALAAADAMVLLREHDDMESVLEHMGQDEQLSRLHVVNILLGMQAAGRLDDLTYILAQAMKIVREMKETASGNKHAA